MDFRHEWKHEINPCDMAILRQRLRAVMKPDPHASNGSYFVRSLYFDNAADRVLRDKLDGINNREKFRIRYYNHDPSLIRLEKKSKRSGLVCKESALLTAAEVQLLIDGRWEWMKESDKPLVCELYSKMISQGLRPRTIVDYTREPFIYGPGNVRVTLDYSIRTGLHSTDFLNCQCVTVPIGSRPIIMEVKWDHFLPDLIWDIVQLESRRTTAFSKYAICRIYD